LINYSTLAVVNVISDRERLVKAVSESQPDDNNAFDQLLAGYLNLLADFLNFQVSENYIKLLFCVSRRALEKAESFIKFIFIANLSASICPTCT